MAVIQVVLNFFFFKQNNIFILQSVIFYMQSAHLITQD